MKRFFSNLILGAMLISGTLFGMQQIDMRAQRAATPVVVKLTDTLKIIDGVAWVTLDILRDYSYKAFRENLQFVQAYGINSMHLTMLNPGGDIYPMWGVYDLLQSAIDKGLVLHTHAHGMIASAAVPIFLLGEVRTLQEHGYIMIHSHDIAQSEYQPKSVNAMAAAWTESYIAILLERTTMGEEEIRKYLDNAGVPSIQFWMNYDQAEARGFLKPAAEDHVIK